MCGRRPPRPRPPRAPPRSSTRPRSCVPARRPRWAPSGFARRLLGSDNGLPTFGALPARHAHSARRAAPPRRRARTQRAPPPPPREAALPADAAAALAASAEKVGGARAGAAGGRARPRGGGRPDGRGGARRRGRGRGSRVGAAVREQDDFGQFTPLATRTRRGRCTRTTSRFSHALGLWRTTSRHERQATLALLSREAQPIL